MERIPVETLALPVRGLRLRGDSLGAELGNEATLLVFLRHLGWTFCRETVRDLRRAVEEDPGYPRVLFVFPTEVEPGEAFFGRLWPEARAVSDPGAELYRAFGLGRKSVLSMFDPSLVGAGLRALLKGNSVGLPQGDPFLEPGLVLVRGDQRLWQHRFEHIGDHPDWRAIAGLAREAGRD